MNITAYLETAVVAMIVIAMILVLVRFELYCLADIRQTPDHAFRYLSRQGWVLVCLISIPIGGILYLRFGRYR
jgi:hypothetical protein